ncbi:serine hydrolase [Aurantiacibacter aquimixticola]|uniref:Beta-lactamase n=1 Tax=Aurantiacibacter aquimixticola TaxID=1958945 RepID=A0A419RVD0_9SPHN|nr:serine hydrolase [Aurantiacibacter aquimixticola]RJY09746.1 serine hydrolase [Aurantiacibacter aquimixticola]
MKVSRIGRFVSLVALALAPLAPANAQEAGFENAFDNAFGTEVRAPRDFATNSASTNSAVQQRISQLAEGSQGRIGVAAIDLTTGESISILGDQRFPMASTSKIAIAATFLEGVDQGRWSLTSEFPLLWAVRSRRFSSAAAPVRQGEYMTAHRLIDLMITRSSNPATDALLAAVGGPQAVNDWARRAGLEDFSLDRDIATLVRDDGEHDPVTYIDRRDSATPNTMVQMLAGIYQGRWLSGTSRNVIISAMERCRTGTRRIPAQMPSYVNVAHKTGTLNRTASDIGIIEMPDGRAIAMAIYVTGQSANQADENANKTRSRLRRDARIASIARGIYDGFAEEASRRNYANAQYNAVR